jgi:predicted ATPase
MTSNSSTSTDVAQQAAADDGSGATARERKHTTSRARVNTPAAKRGRARSVGAAATREAAVARAAAAVAPSTVDPSMPLLSEVIFKQEYRCFAKDQHLQFRVGVNLLVGEQGCGKSSLISLLRSLGEGSRMGGKYERERTLGIIVFTAQTCQLRGFDFEKDNPRTQSGFGDNVGFQVASMFSSHGEASRALQNGIIEDLETATEPRLLLLDEPDMALSPRSAHALAAAFRDAGVRGHQIIAAVHNPILISSQPQVFSFEHKRWMDSAEFLRAHELPASLRA